MEELRATSYPPNMNTPTTSYSSAEPHLPLVTRLPTILDDPAFSYVPLSGSVSTLISGRTLNLVSVLGAFAFFSVAIWKARTNTRKRLAGSEGKFAAGTLAQNVSHLLACNELASESPSFGLELSSDLDDTLDEPSIISPSGTGYSLPQSSPKMLTPNETPSVSLSIDSPAFRYIWKNNAMAVAEIASSKRRAVVVTKLQRWAASGSKRRERPASQSAKAQQLSPSASLLSMRASASDGFSPSSSLSFREDRVGGSPGYETSVSPRGDWKRRARRECLKARAREVEAIQAALEDFDEM